MRHDRSKKKHLPQGALNPAVLLGPPAQTPPAGWAAGPRGQARWEDAARPSAPTVQLGRGRDAGRLQAGPGWVAVTEALGRVRKPGQHTARGVPGRPRLWPRDHGARTLQGARRSAVSLPLPRGPGAGSPGVLPMVPLLASEGPLKIHVYRPDMLPLKNAARSAGLPGGGERGALQVVSVTHPCVEQGQPSGADVHLVRGKNADPEGWRPDVPEARRVACGAGTGLCRPARMPPSCGLGGFWVPRTVAPSLVSQSCPLSSWLQSIERPVVSDFQGGTGLLTHWAQLRGPGACGPSASLTVSVWAQWRSQV